MFSCCLLVHPQTNARERREWISTHYAYPSERIGEVEGKWKARNDLKNAPRSTYRYVLTLSLIQNLNRPLLFQIRAQFSTRFLILTKQRPSTKAQKKNGVIRKIEIWKYSWKQDWKIEPLKEWKLVAILFNTRVAYMQYWTNSQLRMEQAAQRARRLLILVACFGFRFVVYCSHINSVQFALRRRRLRWKW